MGQNSGPATGSISGRQSETEKSGLYHNKKAWADYMQQTAVPIEPDEEPIREGLLYNPEVWATW